METPGEVFDRIINDTANWDQVEATWRPDSLSLIIIVSKDGKTGSGTELYFGGVSKPSLNEIVKSEFEKSK